MSVSKLLNLSSALSGQAVRRAHTFFNHLCISRCSEGAISTSGDGLLPPCSIREEGNKRAGGGCSNTSG